MEAYEVFAEVYDLFMDNVPYEKWSRYIVDCLGKMNIKDGLILDLGCGTGTLTEDLSRMGYDMIGVDQSAEMLDVAMERREKSGLDILYLQQDMREFELYGTVRAVVSSCDCMNYILEEEELQQVFSLVNNYLDPGGIFFFDFNTKYKYESVLGDQTIAENREEGSFIWENYYYTEEEINEYILTLFIKEKNGLYEKQEERHYQKAYTLPVIKELLQKSGLEFVCAYDDYSLNPATDKSERICVVAREKEKRHE